MTKATKTKHRRGTGRVAFLARLDDFRRLLENGLPQRWIYDEYAADLGISYPQFTRYVSKYLTGKATHDQHQKQGPAGDERPGTTSSTTGDQRPAASLGRRPGFQHNPNSGNERDDLI